jgi:HlyD family secretion protein
MDIARPQNKWKKRMTRGGAVAGVVAALAAITVGLSRLEPADPSVERAAVVIDTVERGSMLRQVRGYGKLVPEEMNWIPATTQGRVERILVQPGAVVRPDTVVLEMTNPELERDAASAEMDVKAAVADHTALRVRLEKEVLDQRSLLATIQASHSQAVLEAQLNEQLAKDGLVDNLKLQLSKTRADELTTRLEIEKRRLEISNEAVEAQLAAQAARVDQSRAMARLKQSQFADLKVRAGAPGVLALMQVEVGQQVVPGTNLARVANPARLKAEIKIPETQAKDIQIGQKATVDTHNGIIEGHVARIDPAVVEGSVTVDIGLDGELPRGARPDLSVDGTVELEHLENILFVGRPAFGQEQSTASMFLVEKANPRAGRVQVRFGRASVNAMEVLEGLQEGDEVIISDMSAWDSFDHVRLQ